MADQHTSQHRDSGTVTFKPTEDQVVVPGGRRQFGRWALASAGLLALAACGGGSSGSGSDSSSGRVDLYWAFDQFREGMVKQDVLRLIGEEPNANYTGDIWEWIYSPQALTVFFDKREFDRVTGVRVGTLDASRPTKYQGFTI